jgi:hypothetical protein
VTLLPNKHVPAERSLIGLGAILLERLDSSMTVSALWDSVRHHTEVGSFSNFILALDLLYAIAAIDYQHGFLIRAGQR